jgi:hypothetical protein
VLADVLDPGVFGWHPGMVGEGVFVSYRRSDSLGSAHHLHRELKQALKELDGHDERRVFLDVDSILPGHDYRKVVEDTVRGCIVLLVVIGPRWLSATDSSGRRRLESPSDLHALEISTAFDMGTTVIPVLVEGAQMPASEDLPTHLSDLSFRQAHRVEVGPRFVDDISALASGIIEIERAAEEVREAEDKRIARAKREAEGLPIAARVAAATLILTILGLAAVGGLICVGMVQALALALGLITYLWRWLRLRVGTLLGDRAGNADRYRNGLDSLNDDTRRWWTVMSENTRRTWHYTTGTFGVVTAWTRDGRRDGGTLAERLDRVEWEKWERPILGATADSHS